MPLESPEIRSPSASHNTEFKTIHEKQLRSKTWKPRKSHVYTLSILRNQPECSWFRDRDKCSNKKSTFFGATVLRQKRAYTCWDLILFARKVTRRHVSGITSRNVFFAHTHVHEPLRSTSDIIGSCFSLFSLLFLMKYFETRHLPFFSILQRQSRLWKLEFTVYFCR